MTNSRFISKCIKAAVRQAVAHCPLLKGIGLICVIFFSFYTFSGAQVIVSFEPALNGRTIEGLQRIKIINSMTGDVRGFLKVNVQDETGNLVVNILTPSFMIHPGSNMINSSVFANSRISFGNSRAVQVLNQTGRFPEGSFEYCFEFNADPSKPNEAPVPYENCFNFYVQPYTPLLLISPPDKSTICNPRPDFVWQPPFPAGISMRYRVLVSEIRADQQPSEALLNNLPLINQAELTSNLLLYPSPVASLVKGRTYAWQAIAYINDAVVQRSEIWTFTYDCDKAEADSSFDSYREVTGSGNGNYYIASKTLKFALRNPYKKRSLNYSVVDLAEPLKEIRRLPVIQLENGLNKIDLKLNNNKSFINGHTYLMRLNNISNHQVILRFIYEE